MSVWRFPLPASLRALCVVGATLAATSACAGLIGANFDKSEDPDFGKLESNTGGAGGAKDAVGDKGETGGDTLSPSDDTTPPSVVSVVPSDGAKGIGEGQFIVVEFSEPMNQSMTEAAFRSDALPAGSASFEWNADGTVLKIRPNEPLPYAEGDETVAAFSISYFFDGAKDLAGNALAVERYSFSTLRRIVYELAPSYRRSIKLTAEGYGESTYAFGGGGSPPNEHSRGLVKFDISSLPKIADVSQIDAHLKGTIAPLAGGDAFFLYGVLSIARVDDVSSFEAEFKSMATGTPLGYVEKNRDYDIDVSSAFRTDYVNRAEIGYVLSYGYYFPGFKTGYIARSAYTATLQLVHLEP